MSLLEISPCQQLILVLCVVVSAENITMPTDYASFMCSCLCSAENITMPTAYASSMCLHLVIEVKLFSISSHHIFNLIKSTGKTSLHSQSAQSTCVFVSSFCLTIKKLSLCYRDLDCNVLLDVVL